MEGIRVDPDKVWAKVKPHVREGKGPMGFDDDPSTEIHEVPKLEDDYTQVVAAGVGFRGNSFKRRLPRLRVGVDGRKVGVGEVFQTKRRWLIEGWDHVGAEQRFFPGWEAPSSLVGAEHRPLSKIKDIYDSYNIRGATVSTWLKRRLSVPGVSIERLYLERGGEDLRIPQNPESFGLGDTPAVIVEQSRKTGLDLE